MVVIHKNYIYCCQSCKMQLLEAKVDIHLYDKIDIGKLILSEKAIVNNYVLSCKKCGSAQYKYINPNNWIKKPKIVYTEFNRIKDTGIETPIIFDNTCPHSNKRKSQMLNGDEFWYCPDCKKEIK